MSMSISTLVLAAIWILLGRERAPWRGQRPDPHAEAFAPATLALIFISRGRRVCARSVVRFKRRRGQCGGAPKRFKDCGPTEHRWRHSWQPFAFQMRPRSGTRQIAFATCNASPADKGRLLLVAREPSRK